MITKKGYWNIFKEDNEEKYVGLLEPWRKKI